MCPRIRNTEGRKLFSAQLDIVCLMNKSKKIKVICWVSDAVFTINHGRRVSIVTFSRGMNYGEALALLRKNEISLVDVHDAIDFVNEHGKTIEHGDLVCAVSDTKNEDYAVVLTLPGFQTGYTLKTLEKIGYAGLGYFQNTRFLVYV